MTITELPDNGFNLARVVLRNPASSAIAIAAALEVLDASTAPADVRLCEEWRAKMIPRADYAVDPWAGHITRDEYDEITSVVMAGGVITHRNDIPVTDPKIQEALMEWLRRNSTKGTVLHPHHPISYQINDMWRKVDAIDRQQQRRRLMLVLVIAAGVALAAVMASAIIERTQATVEAAQNWKG